MKYLVLELPEKPTSDDVVELSKIMADFPLRWWTADAALLGTVENIGLLVETLHMDAGSSNFDSELRFDLALALADTQVLLGEGEYNGDQNSVGQDEPRVDE